jgi:hypothetical protein
VRLWELATGHERTERDLPVMEIERRLSGLRAKEAAALVERLAEQRAHAMYRGHAHAVLGAAFAPDGRLLATGSVDQTLRLWDVLTGAEVGRAEGDGGQVWGLAFSPDGSRLASAGRSPSPLVWDVRALTAGKPPAPPPVPPGGAAALWNDLGSEDAIRAYRTLRTLAGAPVLAIPLLRERLRPFRLAVAETRRVERLIADLGSERFAVRRDAARELEKLGPAAEHGLRQALAAAQTVEQSRRIEALLARLRTPRSAAELRAVRGVELLEWLGGPEMREVLRGLAEGDAGARLTREARASLRRLSGRIAGRP